MALGEDIEMQVLGMAMGLARLTASIRDLLSRANRHAGARRPHTAAEYPRRRNGRLRRRAAS